MPNPVIHINQLSNVDWKDGSLSKFTPGDSCDIWSICISSKISELDTLIFLLNTDERERASRYLREYDQQRFMISRAYLRILLGKYLHRDPKDVIFKIGDNKKPYIEDSELQYNVSHSGDYILIAIANSLVGADVENPDPTMHFDDIMEISYSEIEIAFVKNALDKVDSFYILWTRKEALLKATAKGIDDDLEFIPSLDGDHSISAAIIGSNESWVVNTFLIDDEHIGSVASLSGKCAFWKLA